MLAVLNVAAFLALCGSILAGFWTPPAILAEFLAFGELTLAVAGIVWLIATPSAAQTRSARLVARHAPGWKHLVR